MICRGAIGTVVNSKVRDLNECSVRVLTQWLDRLTVVVVRKHKTFSKGDTFIVPLEQFRPNSR